MEQGEVKNAEHTKNCFGKTACIKNVDDTAKAGTLWKGGVNV